MQIIPVIDLKQGQAVHAIAGERKNYQPLKLKESSPGDPLALAKYYAARKPTAIYLADLDAISGRAAQLETWLAIQATANCPLWLDCGVRSADSLLPYFELRRQSPLPHCLVLGSETLQSVSQLQEIAEKILPERLIISLDRKEGKPISGSDAADEAALLRSAQCSGIRRVIALDLAGVGKGRARELLDRWRAILRTFPEFDWILGGGIANETDLQLAEQCGFRAVLSATAILSGSL
jgi:phosphoribosylformimino-5-aminoimidazole carboxamide ribotide isomerase